MGKARRPGPCRGCRPRGESPAQGPCRSCAFLRAGRLQKLLWMWSGVQSVPGPWSAPPDASSNYCPKSGLPWSLPVLELMVGGGGGYGPSWAQRSQPSSERRGPDPWTLSVRDTPSLPQPLSLVWGLGRPAGGGPSRVVGEPTSLKHFSSHSSCTRSQREDPNPPWASLW